MTAGVTAGMKSALEEFRGLNKTEMASDFKKARRRNDNVRSLKAEQDQQPREHRNEHLVARSFPIPMYGPLILFSRTLQGQMYETCWT